MKANIIIFIFLFSISLYARIRVAPPNPIKYDYLYKSGNVGQYLASAFHTSIDPSNTSGTKFKSREPALGNFYVLVIPIGFIDNQNVTVNESLLDQFNDYYKEVSHNQFSLQFIIAPKVISTHKYSYYGADSNGTDTGADHQIYELAREAIDLLKSASFDFEGRKNLLDSDNNGIIDHVMLIHAGGAQENGDSGDIWSHMWKIINGSDDDDNIAGDTADGEQASASLKAVNYTCFSNSSPLGIICHEFGHDLGLVDLYAVNYSSNGVGDWELMCTGCWNGPSYNGESPSYLSAHSRYYLGWVDPEDISGSSGDFSLTPVEDSSDKMYRISLSDTEYFLLENRQKMGSDSYIPGSGMLIWHIDEQVLADNWQKNTINTNPSHMGIALMQADGNKDLELMRGRGDDGDPFPGTSHNSSFTPQTNPSSESYYSTIKSSIFLSSIAVSGSNITFSKQGSFGYIAGIIPHPLDNNLIFIIIRTTAIPDSIPNLTVKEENGLTNQVSLNQLDTMLFEGTYEVSNVNNDVTLSISSSVNSKIKDATLKFTSNDSIKKAYMGPIR